ncbi:hypothetical protein TKK_0005991 [Trichogramma kaykai]|uniref:ADP-ribosylation factor-like protein 16 n=1 Tax=Trichogramma kaykai TaxID=54128 RepID=A0ABD2XGG4_9HYME
MTICLGPLDSGKTLLMKRLADEEIDEATVTEKTLNVETYRVLSPNCKFDILIRECGGTMAPRWKEYLPNVQKIIFVIDASNLCQISAAGVLLYTLLTDPSLQKVRFALVLTKMDWSYRQMRNEALLMLQFTRLKKEVKQEIQVLEVSALTGDGVDKLKEWIFDPVTLENASKHN